MDPFGLVGDVLVVIAASTAEQIEWAGTLPRTTVPRATLAPSPMMTPGATTALAAIHTPSPIRIGVASRSKLSFRQS